MTIKDPDARYESARQAFEIFWRRKEKNLHTVFPGIVESYDPATKRARVQPALRLLLTMSETEFSNYSGPAPDRIQRQGNVVNFTVRKPPILNVPVLQPATGRYLVHHEILRGDPVLLLASERGIDNYKINWGKHADPVLGAFHQMRDCFAIPWGFEDIAPVSNQGVVIQDGAGDTYVHLVGDTITMKNGQSTITVGTDSITLDSPVVEIRGATDTLRVP